MILPYLHYGSQLWAYCAQTELNKIIKLQKRAVRIISKTKYNYHTPPIFKSLKLLTLVDIIKLNELKFYAKFRNNELPHYQMQNLNTVMQNRTRKNEILTIPRTKSKFAEKSIFYQCPITINKTCQSITTKAITHTFKSYVKYAKSKMINEYKIECTRVGCPDCSCRTRNTQHTTPNSHNHNTQT